MPDDEPSNVTSPGHLPSERSSAAGGAVTVVDRPDVLNPTAASNVVLSPDPELPNVVRAEFWNGDHRSYGASARVTETRSEVNVAIVTGVLPEAEGQPAPAVAELQRLDIPLSSPLSGRRLTGGKASGEA